jgi:adenylosuccinate synthase
MRYVIAISGPVAVGKTGVLELLENRFGARRISTRKLILERKSVPSERGALQTAGDELDRETDGAWVAEGVSSILAAGGAPDAVLVDSVRIKPQIDHLRRSFGSRVVHIHLNAPLDVLSERYLGRPRELREFDTYDEVRTSATEAAVGELRNVADVVVDTDRCDPISVLARAVAGLGLYPTEPTPLVDVIVGGQYGSEGKGNICACLATDYGVLMRVGGPNAGHRVAFPAYDYVQLPSGTQSNPNAQILVGAGATIWVDTILKEIKDLGLTRERLSIDPQAMIIEKSDRDLEAEALEAIGSTKKGVGFATARKIIGRGKKVQLQAEVRLAKHIEELKPFLADTKTELEKAYASGTRIMLEGTQGTDLSLHHASFPHVTSRETTASGCLADAGIAPRRVRRVIMVTRTYPIRVGSGAGDSGPLPHEISLKTISDRSGVPLDDLERTEVGTVSRKPRRIGEFNWEQLRRSAVLNGATDIALTFADYLSVANREARQFDQLTPETQSFVATVERVANAPVSLISTRFHPRGVIDRRSWR